MLRDVQLYEDAAILAENEGLLEFGLYKSDLRGMPSLLEEEPDKVCHALLALANPTV